MFDTVLAAKDGRIVATKRGIRRAFDRHLRWRHAKFLLPWRSVAEKLGLREVCSGLDNFWGQMQRSLSTGSGANSGRDDSVHCETVQM